MVKKIIKNSICIILVLLLCLSCSSIENSYNVDRLRSNVWVGDSNELAKGYADKLFIPSNIDNLVENISADSYYISSVDRNNTDFLRYKNPYKQMPIASLTKIMTALVVLKNCDNLDELYYVSTDAVDLEKLASKADLKVGDQVSVKDLLYGLLLPSGNDAANVLAENLDGSIDNFLILMNNEAERLGCLKTHFANPNGLDSQYHYSTSYDLYLMLMEINKYPLFKEITSKKEWTANILQSDGTYRKQTWQNTNFFVLGDITISPNVVLLAGKTGFTSSAGNCLAIVSRSKKTNEEYISIVLNANSKNNTYRNTNSLLNEIEK